MIKKQEDGADLALVQYQIKGLFQPEARTVSRPWM